MPDIPTKGQDFECYSGIVWIWPRETRIFSGMDILESLLYILASPVCYLLVIMTISCVDSNILGAGAPWTVPYLMLFVRLSTSGLGLTCDHYHETITDTCRAHNLKAYMIEEWTFCSLGDKRWCLNSSIWATHEWLSYKPSEKSNEIKQQSHWAELSSVTHPRNWLYPVSFIHYPCPPFLFSEFYSI